MSEYMCVWTLMPWYMCRNCVEISRVEDFSFPVSHRICPLKTSAEYRAGVGGFVPQLLPLLARACQCSSGSTQLQFQENAGFWATPSYCVADQSPSLWIALDAACPPLIINRPFLKLSCPFGWREEACLLPAETLAYTKHFLICI